MIKEIIDHINCKIKELILVKNIYGLCELISDNGKEYPSFYEFGDYKKISLENGTIFHLKEGSYNQEQNEDESTTACDVYIERTYKLSLVAIVKKDIKGNDSYSDERIASLIANSLESNNKKELRELISVDSVIISSKTIDTNRNNIFSKVFKKIDLFIDFEYSMILIDYTILIGADKSCFVNC